MQLIKDNDNNFFGEVHFIHVSVMSKNLSLLEIVSYRLYVMMYMY